MSPRVALSGVLAVAALSGARPRARHRPHARGGPEPGDAPDPRRAPNPYLGVTLDHVTGLGPMLSSLAALPEPPTARVYFDVHEPAGYYAAPVAKIAAGAQDALRKHAPLGEALAVAFEEEASALLQWVSA